MAMEYFDEKIVPILKKKLPGADLSGRLIGSAPGECDGRVPARWLQISVVLTRPVPQWQVRPPP